MKIKMKIDKNKKEEKSDQVTDMLVLPASE